MQNHFQLLQLPPQFDIALPVLDANYRRLQTEVHPDKFVNASPAEKLQSMHMATLVNEAYQTLKSPSQRAKYLLRLQGIDVDDPQQAPLPTAFLMQQMEWRESMEEAKQVSDLPILESLLHETRQAAKALETDIAKQLLVDPQGAVVRVKQLLFIEKVSADLHQRIAQLED